MKANRPVAPIDGSASGNAMRKKVWKRLQWSSTAASKISAGILRKNTDRISTVKGSAFAVCTRMMPACVPTRPSACSIM